MANVNVFAPKLWEEDCLVSKTFNDIWPVQWMEPKPLPTDTFCSDTVYVDIGPYILPSFAEVCSFGNWSSDSYH